MIKYIAFFMLCVFSLSVFGSGEVIEPNNHVMTTNSDGELVKIFGPSSFGFDGMGFNNPVALINGTLKIGKG